MQTHDHLDTASRLDQLAQALGNYPDLIDPDFDPGLDDLEREFSELRMQFND